ncbi:kinesin-like protein KIF20A isoform X2 [Bombus impatiens]|uniref:Kinesin-like protein KIF20A isoform X2 n=1 Tax=Bombus impatiens TaxID=132113 RepID=A0A6P3USJ1_BOMIM|nr:kinesin-like protein KIF20A isoform X2 [Bombus impatiens]
MNNTLDSIRTSYNNPPDDMSYLFGRDPSILAYGKRPCVLKETKKNLLSVYDTETQSEESNYTVQSGSLNSESETLQTVKVYLRMKPFPKKLKLSEEQQDAYKIINSTTLFTRLPTLDNNTSCFKRSNSTDIVCRKFTFTKTFGPETTQLELFEQSIKQQMIDFLNGQNCTIMTYGTTNSGKSYTLQGTTTSPGIVPRCLEFVFSNITPKSTPSYKPMNHCDIVILDPLERAQELEIKTKLLTFASVDKYQFINAYKDMQKLLQEESPIRPSQCIGAHYSVWVSFAEIYNEIVYDLLSNECQKKRTPLKLATDAHGRTFIKGLKTVCVNSGSEAYQVLMAGQYNLKVAATALNARSSRSHCIFTIKLLKYYIENDPSSVEVSTFAFCDLAGSERLKKTLNIGDRLKEAQNINTSLLVLGRCLKTIHDGQLSKQKIEHIGPFRESKLTRLFQKALSGKEHIILIVNINPIPNLYIETQNVLNFSAIAKKIVIEKEKVCKKTKSRFSRIVTQSIKTETDWDATELESEDWQNIVDDNSDYAQSEDYNELISENKRLKKELATLKSSALTRDLQIREEMADTYTSIMKNLETEWKNRMKDVEEQQEDVLHWSVKQVEDFYKEKLEQLNSRKRRRSSVSINNLDLDGDPKNIQELEIENSHLTSKIILLKNSMKELKEANQNLIAEKTKITFELSLSKEDLKNANNLLNAVRKDVCLDEDVTCYVEELNSQLSAREEQVKKLKIFLNEAKQEYIDITTKEREKERIIKEQEEELYDKQETIDDLEAELAHINLCLTEETKTVDIFEEKLENQNKIILNYENKVQDLEDQIRKLENENLLLNEFKLLKETVDTECKDIKGRNIAIEENLSSDLKVEVVIVDSNNKHTQTEHISDAQMEETVLAVGKENSALEEKLVRSTTEIQSLKQELEFAKVKLKDISEQIRNLRMNSTQSKNRNDESVKEKVTVETVDISCQAHVESNEASLQTSKNDVFNKSSQTIENMIKEKASQTSFTEETDDYEIILDKLTKLMVKYDDIKTQYEEKCLMKEEVDQKVLGLEEKIEKLVEENNESKANVEEYKQSIDLLQKELSLTKKDKMQVQEMLKNANNIKAFLKTETSDYEQESKENDGQLSFSKSDCSECTEKLNALQAEFDNHISKCKNDHEEATNKLQRELSSMAEKYNIKSQCLDAHAAKIVELERNLDSITELQEKIRELNKSLETCQAEKDQLQKLLDENNDKLLQLEDRLGQAEEQEREKDAEIISLQKEMKFMIQKHEENNDRSDKLMEIEMKSTIKNLTDTKEMLARKQEYIEQLEMRVKHSEQNAKILDLLEQTAQERKEENERLRTVNDELRNGLIEKEREMESFMKNRDEMVAKYESLVKSQQEELEKQKQKLIKNRSKDKECCENTSEDEVILKDRRVRRPPKKFTPSSPKQDEISVIDLSGSDSKRSVKRTTTLPSRETASEKKKNTRKKKLYITEDESFQDIEPLESTLTITPSVSTRKLRSRRK